MKLLGFTNEVTQLIQEINKDTLELLQITNEFESGVVKKNHHDLVQELSESIHFVNRAIQPMRARIDGNSSVYEDILINFDYPYGYDCFKVLSSNERSIIFREDPALNRQYHNTHGYMKMRKHNTKVSLFGKYGVMFENPSYDIDVSHQGQLRVVKYALFNFSNTTELKSFLVGMRGVLGSIDK